MGLSKGRAAVWLAALCLLPLAAQETLALRPETKSSVAEQSEPDAKGGPGARALSHVTRPTLTVYLPPREKATGTAIIICPGGGYRQLMIDREGHQVARWLNTLGVAGIVLKYRLPEGDRLREALGDARSAALAVQVSFEDAQEAVRMVRANAARWGLEANRVGMMGFSAGGHLTSLTGLLAPAAARPDFQALLYPAIPRNLEIPSGMPPTFLAAAVNDPRLSPLDHALRFFTALRQAGVPAELHVYSSGGHGFALRKEDGTAAGWPSVFAAWLKNL
jgi:acetyl esterase/lipase